MATEGWNWGTVTVNKHIIAFNAPKDDLSSDTSVDEKPEGGAEESDSFPDEYFHVAT